MVYRVSVFVTRAAEPGEIGHRNRSRCCEDCGVTAALNRDQLIALMVAERDAELHGRGEVRPLEWPDAANRLAKAVEFRGVDDVGEVVVEHTRIESYDSQIDDRMAVSKIFPKFGPEIPDRWEAGGAARDSAEARPRREGAEAP